MMKIVLISNYSPDRQESMIRFAHLLDKGFRRVGVETEIWTPRIIFGAKAKSTNAGIGKWLGYLDKYLIFPFLLRWRLRQKQYKNPDVRFHVCDHSNAPYLKYLPANRSSITCHDVIAIRGGLGFTDFHHPASLLGTILQKWILHSLIRSKSIAFVSELTLKQFKEVAGKSACQGDYKVIHNAFNADFKPMPKEKAKEILIPLGIDLNTPFLLHIGSGLPRKNRKLLLDMVDSLKDREKINICFAGEKLDNELLAHIATLGLESRVMSVEKPDHLTLVALYSLCSAFIFPSLSEGFGWPVIEAQACGAPVIASDVEPMPEVSGGAALHVDPTKPEAFADAYISLHNESLRNELIQRGFQNGLRFDTKLMISAYLNLHNYKSV